MRRILLVLLLAVSCVKPEPSAPPPEPDQPVTDAAERSSLLDLAHGAAVVSRTGEAILEDSALRAVDGDPGSFWMSPLHDLPQSMVIALPARSRIERVGIRTVGKGGFTANQVTFEASADGRLFTSITTAKAAANSNPQWFDVKPTEASYLRVTMVDSILPDHDVRLYSVLATGSELEQPRPGDITGCWSINGEQAVFLRRGTRVIGVLQAGKEPIRFQGGFDGRIYRLNWIRGNDYGVTLMTVAPDGQHLSATNWHEEAIPMFFDTSWFGERRTCSTAIADSGEVARALLQRNGRFALYDDTDLRRLLQAFPNARLVAHEFRFPTTQQNREAAERALAPLRKQFADLKGATFVAQGSDAPRQDPVTESMRALYSTIELEIRR